MTGTKQTEAYFSSVASGYQSSSRGRLWNLVRERESRAFFAHLGDLKGSEVLELGCGAGFYTRQLLAAGARHVWAVDLSAAMLAELPHDNVTALQSDATTVNPGRTFDTMVSAGMLEFVPDPAAVLANAARLARRGARLVLLFPTRSLLGRAYQRFHSRHGLEITLFDRPRLEALAARTGWTLARLTPAGPYSATSLLVREARG